VLGLSVGFFEVTGGVKFGRAFFGLVCFFGVTARFAEGYANDSLGDEAACVDVPFGVGAGFGAEELESKPELAISCLCTIIMSLMFAEGQRVLPQVVPLLIDESSLDIGNPFQIVGSYEIPRGRELTSSC
jgi:hypothetical protein